MLSSDALPAGVQQFPTIEPIVMYCLPGLEQLFLPLSQPPLAQEPPEEIVTGPEP